MALLISIIVFIVVVALIILFGYRRYVLAGRVYENLDAPTPDFMSPVATPVSSEYQTISRAAEFVAGKLPPSAETASDLQLKLLAAGYRQTNAVAILYGLKLMLMAGTTVIMLSSSRRTRLPPAALVTADPGNRALGVFGRLQVAGLRSAKRIKRRKNKLREGFARCSGPGELFAPKPDSLSIVRFRNVSQQLGIVHPETVRRIQSVHGGDQRRGSAQERGA